MPIRTTSPLVAIAAVCALGAPLTLRAEPPAAPAARPAPAAAPLKEAMMRRGESLRLEAKSIRQTQIDVLKSRYPKTVGSLKTAVDQLQAALLARADLMDKIAAACEKGDAESVKAMEGELALSALQCRTKTELVSARAREADYLNEGSLNQWQTVYPEATEELTAFVAARKEAAASAGRWATALESNPDQAEEARDASTYTDALAQMHYRYWMAQGDYKRRLAAATAKQSQEVIDALAPLPKLNQDIFAAAKDVATRTDAINKLVRERNKALQAVAAASAPAPAKGK